MNRLAIKTSLCLIAMIAILILAIVTKDIVHSKLFASLVLTIGALASSRLSDNDTLG